MKEDHHLGPGPWQARLIRFGAIELDVRAAELRKHGLKIRLHKQSFEILLMLVEHPGEVVLREEIRKKLWPNDTIVEFDHSINAAIQKLREALGESADKPRYVETVARRGYRFIGTIEAAPGEPLREPPEPSEHPPDGRPSVLDTSDLSGETFSHFRVVEKLGSGGMGVIYRAEDLKLRRQVALKFLPFPAAQVSPQLYQRFQREARAASALNHPNICTIYGVEDFAGQPVIIMELIEGETLSARLAKGKLPLDQALAAAIQMAGALDAAHRKGIVHRDLKPANVMVTKSGVRVLDFGLAKMERAVAVGGDAHAELTEKGAILGTLHYMSPEQVQGKDLDARSDIFSFGLVLYEMLAGRKAFEGENSASVIAAILTSQPAPVPETIVPAALDRALGRCLAKDPDDRWQTARDLAAELNWIATPASGKTPPASSGRRKRTAWGLTAAVTIAVALVAAAVLALVYLRQTPMSPALVRYSVPLPPNTRFADYAYPVVGYPVVSPNGERIALALAPSVGDRIQIWIYQMSTGEFRPMAGTDGAFDFVWTQDGGSLVFWANQRYNWLHLSSSAISTLIEEPHYGRPTIAPNGSMLVSTQSGLELVATNGQRRAVTSRMPNDPFDYFPVLLPDGNRFLFLRGIFPPREIWKGNLDGGAPVRLFSSDSQVEYADSGHLLFVKGDTLFAQPFDSKNAVAVGPAQSLVNGVARLVTSSLAGFSVSRNGVLAFRPGAPTTTTRLTWLDRTGKELGTLGEAADYTSPAFSPDDKRMAVATRDRRTGKRQIWVFDLVRGGYSPLTFDPADHINPTWSPDGARIAFTSNRTGVRDIYITSASGGSEDEVLLESKAHKSVSDWSADGQFLLYNQIEKQVSVNAKPSASTEEIEHIYVLPLSGVDRKPIAFRRTPFREDRPRMSPGGRWIAYGSNESGRIEVYVQPFPANGKKYKISTAGGEEPQWRGDGKELFFVAGATVMAAEVHTQGAELVFGIPKKLFGVHLTDLRSRSRLAITKDGQKFLALEPVGEDPRVPFTVILNWPRLLDQR